MAVGDNPEEVQQLQREHQALKEELARIQRELATLSQLQQRMLRTLVASQGQLKALVRLASSLPSTTQPHQVLEEALDKIVEALEVPAVWAFLLEGEELVLAAHRGFTPEMVAELGRLKLGQYLSGLVAQLGKPLFLEDASLDRRAAPVALRAGYRSFAAVPVRWEGKVLGVMGATRREPRTLGEREQALLQAFADIVASALEHSAQERELREKLDRISTITQLTSIINSSLDIKEVFDVFVHQLQELVPADRVSFSLVEGDMVRVLTLYETEPLGLPEVAKLTDTIFPLEVSRRLPLYIPDMMLEKGLYIYGHWLVERGLRSSLMLPLIHQGEVFAIFALSSRKPHAFGEREREILAELAGQVARAVINHRLYQELKGKQQKLEQAWLEVGLTWVRAWEARYPHNRGHADGVAHYVRRICRGMGMAEDQLKTLELGAKLHDVGMLIIPDSIALKVGRLTLSERAQIELHPTLGRDLLAPLPQFQEVMPLIDHHHERYDGLGYPDGLKGEEIPLGARIIAVADAYDAMTSIRLYRPTLTPEKARRTLQEGAGSQWDPGVVDVFLKVLAIQEEP